MMIKITNTVFLNSSEIKFRFIRAPGPGGQNVNKLATAVELRFNIKQSSLPEAIRHRILFTLAKKITRQGELIIKASRHRTQESNKRDALTRLRLLLKKASIPPKIRKKTKPTRASIERRIASKKLHSKIKSLRRNSQSRVD